MRKESLRKVNAMFLSFILITGVLAGCSKTNTAVDTAAPTPAVNSETPDAQSQAPTTGGDSDKMFNIALTEPFTGFDPLRTNDSASTYVNAQIYETLYRIRPDGSDYICLLAESLPEFSADGLSATIKLREGVLFHDGTPFNAEAVAYTFNLIKDPEFGSSRASIVASIESMDIIDEYTIRLNLKYEDGVLLAKLAHTNSAIVSPTAQAKQDLMIDPVGTGPYKFVSSISGANVVLTRNDEYWGQLPQIKDATMTIVAEESTAVARMETGEADFMPGNLSVEQIPRIEGMANVTFASSESSQIVYFTMRPTSYVNPVMAEKDFRVAMSKAINKEEYVQYIMEGYASVANGVIGPSIFGYTSDAENYGYPYDLEGAKEIIAKNGWADEEILFLLPSTPTYVKLGEYIQANLLLAGFNNIKIEPIDWSAWLTESKSDNRFDLTVAAWSNVTRDGTELFEPNWHSVNSSQRNRADNLELDQLIDESKTTSDKEVRIEKLGEVNKLLMEEAYVVPMYNAQNLYCYNKAYGNVSRDPGGTFYLNDITVNE